MQALMQTAQKPQKTVIKCCRPFAKRAAEGGGPQKRQATLQPSAGRLVF